MLKKLTTIVLFLGFAPTCAMASNDPEHYRKFDQKTCARFDPTYLEEKAEDSIYTIANKIVLRDFQNTCEKFTSNLVYISGEINLKLRDHKNKQEQKSPTFNDTEFELAEEARMKAIDSLTPQFSEIVNKILVSCSYQDTDFDRHSTKFAGPERLLSTFNQIIKVAIEDAWGINNSLETHKGNAYNKIIELGTLLSIYKLDDEKKKKIEEELAVQKRMYLTYKRASDIYYSRVDIERLINEIRSRMLFI